MLVGMYEVHKLEVLGSYIIKGEEGKMSELQRGRRQISASSKEGKKFIPVVRLSSLLLALAYISSGSGAIS